jgi:hypothetical protein
MIGPEEGLETGSLRPPGNRQLLGVGQALLGLDHQGKSHERPPGCGWLAIIVVDAMIARW